MSHSEIHTAPQPAPALHDPFDIDQRIRLTRISKELDGVEGTIVGISMASLVYHYIILLDTPLTVKGHDRPWRAVSIPGGCLEKI